MKADRSLVWQKSSRCDTGSCVEVANTPSRILIRDSKVPGGPILEFTHAEWSSFLVGVRAGEFGQG